jgi:hypothetical protein
MLIDSVPVPPTARVDGVKVLLGAGTALTVSVALAATAFEPPLVVVRPPTGMVLAYAPVAVAVTVTLMVQLPLAGMVPPARLTAVAVLLAVPTAQLVLAVPAVAVMAPGATGKVSVNAAPVRATVLLLATVMVNTLVPPAPMVDAANDLVMVGCANTVTGAVATGLTPRTVLTALVVLV